MSDNGENGKPQNQDEQEPDFRDVGGRPRLPVNQEMFEKLCALRCSLGEIAGVMDVSEDTIERRCKEWYQTTFAEAWTKKSAIYNVSLRRSQFELAKKNPALAIHLGVNYLGQQNSLRVNVRHSGSIDLKQVNEKELTLVQIDRILAGESPDTVLADHKN